MLIAQLSDTHLTDEDGGKAGGVDSFATLSRAVARLNAMRPAPDLVMLTGDLTNAGGVAAYRRLRHVLDGLKAPWALLPGNHDRRAPLRQVFGDQPWMPAEGYVHYVLEVGPLRVIVLDTLVEGEDGGCLCLERLAWLERTLAEDRDRPVVIAMHHPPMLSGLPPFDRDPFRGGDALAAILQGHPNVQRIICGHLHRAVVSHWHGQTVSVAPSTAFSIALELDPDSDFTLGTDGPACALHLWRDGYGLISHLLPV